MDRGRNTAIVARQQIVGLGDLRGDGRKAEALTSGRGGRVVDVLVRIATRIDGCSIVDDGAIGRVVLLAVVRYGVAIRIVVLTRIVLARGGRLQLGVIHLYHTGC